MANNITSELIISNNEETSFDNIPLNNNKLTKEQKILLKKYKDKSLIMGILGKRSYEFFW